MPSTTRPTSRRPTRSTGQDPVTGETAPTDTTASTDTEVSTKPTGEGGSGSGLLGRGVRLLADLASAVDPRGAVSRTGPRPTTIPVDERAEEDAVVFEAELPGFASDDIAVAAQNGRLILHAEHEAPSEDDGEAAATAPRRERRTGPLTRELDLPPGADPWRIDARYADGLLVVRVPLPAPSSTERVEIPVRQRG
jgi:HSP20 family protein